MAEKSPTIERLAIRFGNYAWKHRDDFTFQTDMTDYALGVLRAVYRRGQRDAEQRTSSTPAPAATGPESVALREALTAARKHDEAGPALDCWDTEDGEPAEGAARFASDWSHTAHAEESRRLWEKVWAAQDAALTAAGQATPTPPDEKWIAELREIATAAGKVAPGEWYDDECISREDGTAYDYRAVMFERGTICDTLNAWFCFDPDDRWKLLRHVAAFDPPTTLRLLDAVSAAGQAAPAAAGETAEAEFAALGIPAPLSGYKRVWTRCRECGRVYYRDYVPYSLSNPVTWTACGHSTGHRDLNCDTISEADALAALRAERADGGVRDAG